MTDTETRESATLEALKASDPNAYRVAKELMGFQPALRAEEQRAGALLRGASDVVNATPEINMGFWKFVYDTGLIVEEQFTAITEGSAQAVIAAVETIQGKDGRGIYYFSEDRAIALGTLTSHTLEETPSRFGNIQQETQDVINAWNNGQYGQLLLETGELIADVLRAGVPFISSAIKYATSESDLSFWDSVNIEDVRQEAIHINNDLPGKTYSYDGKTETVTPAIARLISRVDEIGQFTPDTLLGDNQPPMWREGIDTPEQQVLNEQISTIAREENPALHDVGQDAEWQDWAKLGTGATVTSVAAAFSRYGALPLAVGGFGSEALRFAGYEDSANALQGGTIAYGAHNFVQGARYPNGYNPGVSLSKVEADDVARMTGQAARAVRTVDAATDVQQGLRIFSRLKGAARGIVVGAKPTPAAVATTLGGAVIGFIAPKQVEEIEKAIYDATIGAMQESRRNTMIERWGEGGLEAFQTLMSDLPVGHDNALMFSAGRSPLLREAVTLKTNLHELLVTLPDQPTGEQLRAVEEAMLNFSNASYDYIDYQLSVYHGDGALRHVKRDIESLTHTVTESRMNAMETPPTTREEYAALKEAVLTESRAFLPMLAVAGQSFEDMLAHEAIPSNIVVPEEAAPTQSYQEIETLLLSKLTSEEAILAALPAEQNQAYSDALNHLISMNTSLNSTLRSVESGKRRAARNGNNRSLVSALEAEAAIRELMGPSLAKAIEDEGLLVEITALQLGTYAAQQTAQPQHVAPAFPLGTPVEEAPALTSELRGHVANTQLAGVVYLGDADPTGLGDIGLSMGALVDGAAATLPTPEREAMQVTG